MSDTKEFKFLNFNIIDLCIFYAIFLIAWGLIISFISGSNSITSYIPSILGFPILFFSLLSKIFTAKQKLFMHIVVFFIALIFIGGLDFLRSFVGQSGMGSVWASSSKFMMLVSGGIFIYLCIMSFRYARQNKGD